MILTDRPFGPQPRNNPLQPKRKLSLGTPPARITLATVLTVSLGNSTQHMLMSATNMKYRTRFLTDDHRPQRDLWLGSRLSIVLLHGIHQRQRLPIDYGKTPPVPSGLKYKYPR
jgi:hypothetical protein